jgi:DNA-directed RNA polymerase subunit RPC12/RpoP
MICINGAKECTGCMKCQDEYESGQRETLYDCEICGELVNYVEYVDGKYMCLNCVEIYQTEVENGEREQFDFENIGGC